MAGETVLIAAFSGRALAQSARRAGFVPLVADAFGDLDMRDAAEDWRIVPDAMRTGFRTKPLVSALDDLCANAPSKPLGLVFGSGLEDKPRLVAALQKRYGLLANDAETVMACKEPRTFFPILDKLGVAHPETDLAVPEKPADWITKRIGGSGGRHIRNCTSSSRAGRRRYFQKRIAGERISVSAVAVGDGLAMYFTRQWCSPSAREPYRFGGAVSTPDADTEGPSGTAIFKAVAQLMRVFDLNGAASFDFIVDGDAAYLLEINPRPGASIDVVDDEKGSHFAEHVAAFRPDQTYSLAGPPITYAKAAAVLHADRGPLTLGETPWPDWSADRGAPGTSIPHGAPLATIFATGATADEAETLARGRLAELEDLIYAHARHS